MSTCNNTSKAKKKQCHALRGHGRAHDASPWEIWESLTVASIRFAAAKEFRLDNAMPQRCNMSQHASAARKDKPAKPG